jgi:hypothetical protein
MYYKDINVTNDDVQEFFILKSQPVSKYAQDNLKSLIMGYLFDDEINWPLILPYIALKRNYIFSILQSNKLELKSSYKGYLIYKLMADNVSVPQHRKDLIFFNIEDIFYLLKLIRLKQNRYHEIPESIIQFSLCSYLLEHNAIEKDDTEFFNIFYSIITKVFYSRKGMYSSTINTEQDVISYYLKSIPLEKFLEEERKRFAEVCLSIPFFAKEYFNNILNFNVDNEYNIALNTILTQCRHSIILLEVACKSNKLKEEDRLKILKELSLGNVEKINTYRTLCIHNICIELYLGLRQLNNELYRELFIHFMILLGKKSFLQSIFKYETERIRDIIRAYIVISEIRG